jgi:hypothetical protein
VELGTLIPLLSGLVDDAGLFSPSSLPMDRALERHRTATSPMLSGQFLCPAHRVGELFALLDEHGRLDVHLVGGALMDLPRDPRITIHAAELSGSVTSQLPCYVEGVPPRMIEGPIAFGKIRFGGERIPSVEEVASYITESADVSRPFKGTAGMHAAVRGWESTAGVPHHGYLNVLLGVARALSRRDVAQVIASTDAAELAAEARGLPKEEAKATRRMFHSYGSCDTIGPIEDARRLGLLS